MTNTHKTSLKLISLLISVLIISLPSVLATQLNLIQYSGDEGVNGFHRSTDELQIKVQAQVDYDDTISRQQLRLVIADTYVLFQDCQPLAGVFECTYIKPVFALSGVQQYTVQLIDDTEITSTTPTPLLEKSFTLTVDTLQPVIEAIAITPKVSETGDVSVSIRASDRAVLGNDALCSGISTFIFTLDGTIPAGEVSGGDACNWDKPVALKLTVPDGRYNLCVSARDKVGHQSQPSCDSVLIDASAPQVNKVIFLVRGQETDYLNTDGDINVDIILAFDDPNLIPESIWADLGRISPTTGRVQPLRLNKTHYIFRDLSLAGFQTCSIGVTATDTLGNVLEETLTCTLKQDNTPPRFVGFRTNFVDADINFFIGKSTNLTIILEDRGSGIIKQDVYINLQNVKGDAGRHPDHCIEVNDVFECYLAFTTDLEDRPVSITVAGITQDVAGNRMEDPAILNLEVKTNAPVIYSYERLYVSNSDQFVEGYMIPGDLLELRINASNYDPRQVYADMSIIGGDRHKAPVECGITIQNDSICIFDQIAQIADEGFVTVSYAGYNGETTTIEVPVRVYADINSTSPSFWKTSRSNCEPTPVDREITSFMNYRLTCTQKLLPLKPDQELLSMTFDKTKCEGDMQDVADIHLYNPGASPFFGIFLQPADFRVDKSTINCPVSVITRVGNAITRHPEIINITLEWDYYSNPYGEIGNVLNDKLEKELKNVDDIASFVQEAEDIIAFLRKICELKSLISGLIGIADLLLDILGSLAALLKTNPVTEAPGEAVDSARAGFCTGGKGALEKLVSDHWLWQLLDEFCALLNCASTDTNWGGSDEPDYLGAQAFKTAGGGLWCSNINDVLSNVGIKGVKIWDIKESLVLSTVCLCLPGVVRNLNKLMQVKCRYAVCIAEDVVAEGYPVSYCENERNYNMCKYIYGEVFNLIPFADLVGDFVNIFREIYQDPWNALGLVWGLLCDGLCQVSYNLAYAVCIIPKTAAKISDSVVTVTNMLDDGYWDIPDAYCSRALDLLEEQEEAKEEAKEAQRQAEADASGQTT